MQTHIKIPPYTVIIYMVVGAMLGFAMQPNWGLEVLGHESRESFLVLFNYVLFATLILLGSISGPGAKPHTWREIWLRYLSWTFIGTLLRYIFVGAVGYWLIGNFYGVMGAQLVWMIGARLAASDPIANFIRSVLNSVQGKAETAEEVITDNESGSNDGLVLPLVFITEFGFSLGMDKVAAGLVITVGTAIVLALLGIACKYLFGKGVLGQVLSVLFIAAIGAYGSEFAEHSNAFGALTAWLAGYFIAFTRGEENDPDFNLHHVSRMELAKLLTGAIVLMVCLGLSFGRGFAEPLSWYLVAAAFLSRVVLAIPEQGVLKLLGGRYSWRQVLSMAAAGTTGLAVAFQNYIITFNAGDLISAAVIEGFIAKSLIFIVVALAAMIGEN